MQSYYFIKCEKVLAVVSENKVLGFAALLKECCCIENESHAPWLDFLFVDEKYRNQHIGITLIDTVCCYLYYNNQQNDQPICVMHKFI